jgi:hypothetical protein
MVPPVWSRPLQASAKAGAAAKLSAAHVAAAARICLMRISPVLRKARFPSVELVLEYLVPGRTAGSYCKTGTLGNGSGA